MNRNTTTMIGLVILLAGYGLHARFAFVAYHLFKAIALMGR